MELQVMKYSGELAPFSEEKLRNSLLHVGAIDETVDKVVTELRTILYDGISTKEIYKKAHALLKKQEYHKASRYQLKQALLEFGPTGYPFEVFIGELMKSRGYSVQVGLMMKGKCVSHEVDVLAQNGTGLLMFECKFHNQHGYKTDVKVPLYIHSRFRDLEGVWRELPEYRGLRMNGGIVTNARLTQDAIDYGKCTGLEMLSWDYPHGHALKELINKHGLHPITSLQSISKAEKSYLIQQEVVTMKALVSDLKVLEELRLTPAKKHKVMQEVEELCG